MTSPESDRWRVYLRAFDRTILDELDNWISLELRLVFNGVGTFALEMSSDGVSARHMDSSRGIIVTRTNVAGDEMMIFTGRILTEFTRTARTIRCGGVSDAHLLQRPALPDPANPTAPTVPYNAIAGVASSVMRQFVSNNLGPAAHVDRQVAGLSLAADPLAGGTLTGRANGQSVLSVLNEIAATPIAGGLGWELIQTNVMTGALTFRVYEPEDRSAEIQFGVEYGTATDYEDTITGPPATYYYVMAGDGFLNDRTIIGDGDDDLIAQWGRIEALYDARGITSPTELNVKLAELLASATQSRRVNVVPFQVSSQQFYDHWFLGDLVSFVADDETFVDVVREVRINLTTDRGVIVTPLIGNTGSTTDSLTAQHIASVQARLSNIERNWLVPEASILPSMLSAIDSPADNLIPVYDSATGQFEWRTTDEITDSLVLSSLLVTEDATVDRDFAVHRHTTLGNANTDTTDIAGPLTVGAFAQFNAGGDVVGTFGADIFTATATVNSAGNIVAGTTIVAGSTVQGTRLISTVATGTAPLTVASTTVVPNLNASLLEGHPAADFVLDTDLTTALAGYLPLAGGTVTGATTFSNTVSLNGNVNVGNASGDVIDVLGSATFRETVKIDTAALIVNATSLVGSEELRVNGDSLLQGHVNITGGSAAVDNNQAYQGRNSGGTALNLAYVDGGNILNYGDGTATGAVVAAGYVQLKHNTTVRFSVDTTGIGFFGAAPSAKPTIVGSRGGNVALANLLTALATLGLVIDSTTA